MTAQAPASSAIRAWWKRVSNHFSHANAKTHLLSVDNVHDNAALKNPSQYTGGRSPLRGLVPSASEPNHS